MAVVIGFVGFIFFVTPTTDTSDEPDNLADIFYDEIEKDHIYYVEDLIIADTHSSRTDSNVHYCIVLFRDTDDNMVAVNMPVNPDDEIWDDLEDYLEDDELLVGDYTVNCYVKAEKDYTYDDVGSYFMDAVWKYEMDLGHDIKTVEWAFDYVCDEDGDPYEIADGANMVGKVVGVLTMGVAVLILFSAVRRKPKTKKTTASAAPVYTAPAYTPSVQQSQPGSLHFSGRKTAPPDAPAGEDPAVTELKRYQALRDAGFMTDEEFEQTRRKILGL